MATTIVDSVRARTSPLCQTDCCCDSGCCSSVQGLPEPYVLINLEHDDAPKHREHSRQHFHPHCDYLLIAGDDEDGGPWVAPIEMTTGNKDYETLLRQLRAGADIADDLLPAGVSFKFRPIFVHDGRVHPYVINVLLRQQGNSIQFRNETQLIELSRCRGQIAEALAE